MNIVVGTSRGEDIEPYLKSMAAENEIKLIFDSYKGASLRQLQTKAIEIIQTIEDPENIHLYIIGGLPDITTKTKLYREKYEEVIYTETPDYTYDRMTNLITTTADNLSQHVSKIIFCTIIPSSIEKWNLTRLNQHKTKYLKHTDQYESWQRNLHQSLTQINSTITILNKTNKVHTPFLNRIVTDTVIRRSKLSYKFSYTHLPDGVHLDEIAAQKCAQMILNAIKRNRPQVVEKKEQTTQVTDSDGENVSPKRSWRP